MPKDDTTMQIGVSDADGTTEWSKPFTKGDLNNAVADISKLNTFYGEWHDLTLTEVKAYRVDKEAEDRALSLKMTGAFNHYAVRDLSQQLAECIYANDSMFPFKSIKSESISHDPVRLSVGDIHIRFDGMRLESLTVANKEGELTFMLEVTLQFSERAATLFGAFAGGEVKVMFQQTQTSLL